MLDKFLNHEVLHAAHIVESMLLLTCLTTKQLSITLVGKNKLKLPTRLYSTSII